MMPFSSSLGVISEETTNKANEAHEADKLLVSGEMAMSQRSLLLLQKKDEELRMLKKNIQNLEQMSAKFGNRKLESEPNLMRADNLSNQNENSSIHEEHQEKDESVVDLSYFCCQNDLPVQTKCSKRKETSTKTESIQPRKSWQLLQNEFTGDGSYEVDIAIITQSNPYLQLKKELLSESRMRIQDRKMFLEVLDNVDAALRSMRAHPDIAPCQEFVDLATEWFRRELNSETDHEQYFQASKLSETLRGSGDNAEKTRKSILRSLSSSELYHEKETKFVELATHVDRMMDDGLVEKLGRIKCELSGLQMVLQNSRDRVEQERHIQKVAQSAWRVRFQLQLNTIKRLETRYKKVCRCLMKFRRRVKREQKPEKKLKNNRKLPRVILEGEAAMEDHKMCDEIEPENSSKKIGATAFSQGRLKAMAIILTQNRKRIHELTINKEALEKEVLNLKQELLLVNSKKLATSLLDEKDGDISSISNKNTELLASEIITLKNALELAQVEVNVLRDENKSLLREKNLMYVDLRDAKLQLTEMENNFNQKMTVGKSKLHAYEQKFSEFYKQSGLQVQEAKERITAANKKLREFFKMIQLFLERVNNQNLSKSATFLTETYDTASSTSIKDLKFMERSSQDNYNKWINHCRALAKNENFAEEIANFLFNLVSENDSSK